MILETTRLLLRPIEKSDLDAMFVLHRQPHVGPPAGWRPHRSRKETALVLKDFWNQGIAIEAVRAVIDYGFRQRRLMLISAYCYPENYASRRVLEKCGLRHEGTLALCECRYDSRCFDNECYSISAREWSRQIDQGA